MMYQPSHPVCTVKSVLLVPLATIPANVFTALGYENLFMVPPVKLCVVPVFRYSHPGRFRRSAVTRCPGSHKDMGLLPLDSCADVHRIGEMDGLARGVS